MNAAAAIFTFFAAGLVCTLPRRFAPVAILLAAGYMPREAVLEIGPAHFTVLHIVLVFGFVRVLLRREGLAHGWNPVDRRLLLWALVLLATTVFHTSNQWVFRFGMVWNELGCYLLLRSFIRDADDILRVFKMLCVILVPVAILMLVEKATAHNPFDVFGAYPEAIIRDGHVRARGPFAHPILAGTAGATCFPMALFLWKRHPLYALCGLFAAGGIVIACTSSGPIMMVLFTLLGQAFWKMRENMRAIRWFVLVMLLALNAVMHDPVYFLMARIDLTGSSTGWHRSRLIQSSIEHLNEWWLAGTDFTRHWMPTGIHANEVHTDITNHLLGMGVNGGLLLIWIFVLVLVAAFRIVGQAVRAHDDMQVRERFLVWTLGAMLFGHVVNFFSISLFDQSVVFFYLVLATIGAINRRTYTNTQALVPAS